MTHAMQVGIRLDEWHHDRLKKLAKASGMGRSTRAVPLAWRHLKEWPWRMPSKKAA